jgi:hypothetical protein
MKHYHRATIPWDFVDTAIRFRCQYSRCDVRYGAALLRLVVKRRGFVHNIQYADYDTGSR